MVGYAVTIGVVGGAAVSGVMRISVVCGIVVSGPMDKLVGVQALAPTASARGSRTRRFADITGNARSVPCRIRGSRGLGTQATFPDGVRPTVRRGPAGGPTTRLRGAEG